MYSEKVIINGPLATYEGKIVGYDSVIKHVGKKPNKIVRITKLKEIHTEVPDWAIHPTEKVGKDVLFSENSINKN